MTVTRPIEWKGSDLRSRTEVVRYLRQRGGEVADQTGLVVGTMRTELGKGRALSQLLADMEADGMLEREVRGRRTFRITLKDDWDLVPHVLPELEPEPAASGEFDYDQLAAALLAIAMKRASGPVVDSEAPARLKAAEDALIASQDALHQVRAELAERITERDELLERVRLLEHNLQVLQAQMDSRPRRDGPTVAERLSAEELRMLTELQRELPVTPQSRKR